jgi:hypothetical protein
MSKIAVCYMSIGEDYKRWTRYSHKNKLLYCDKYNYTFIEDESVYDDSKPIPWSKLHLILKYLPEYDYIVWIDADILIMNNEISLESIIEKYKEYDIICGSCPRMINTGFLFIKNTEFCKQFLQSVYDNVYDPTSDPHERYHNWEQGSFINLYDKNHLECQTKIRVTVPRELNSYWINYEYGDFVLHGAGIRGELLDYFLNRFIPDRMDVDTDDSYNERMRYLREDFRREHDDLKIRMGY